MHSINVFKSCLSFKVIACLFLVEERNVMVIKKSLFVFVIRNSDSYYREKIKKNYEILDINVVCRVSLY